MPKDPRADLLQGTLDLLILKTLIFGPLHGWAIAKRIQQSSNDVLQVQQGSLYPALYRLVDREWIAGEDALSPEGRRIRVYGLTAEGKKRLRAETSSWQRFSAAVNQVLLEET
jgi:PadR family transcriptional regulator PadR